MKLRLQQFYWDIIIIQASGIKDPIKFLEDLMSDAKSENKNYSIPKIEKNEKEAGLIKRTIKKMLLINDE